MILFKEFLSESISGNYISSNVRTPLEIPELKKFFDEGLICSPKKQHVTLMYSKGTDVAKNKILDFLNNYKDEIVCDTDGTDAFDSTSDDKDLCTIVVKLKSKILTKIYKGLTSELGLSHSYPDFSPHISMMYNVPLSRKLEAIGIANKFLDTHNKKIVLKNYTVNPIIDDWADKMGKK